jgi:transketolase
MTTDLDQLAINTIRTLSMDAVQQANSGHPGTPMAMAPVAYTLWQRHLRFDPNDPIWFNRDRFVLSMGHASMLLYSLLPLAGVKAVNPRYETLGDLSVSLDDIKRFRQLDSRCPGHPEYRWTSGIETTTGPLGQGVATSDGMAIASKWMARYFNRPGFTMVNFDAYALAGDGCLMEGISHAAHGEPLGEDEIKLARRFCGWPEDAKFLAPDGVREHLAGLMGARGAQLRSEWMKAFAGYKAQYPVEADALDRMQRRELPAAWDKGLAEFPPDPKGVAGRDASAKVLNAVAKTIPWLMGGSADLAPSTKTRLTFDGAGDFEAATPGGRNLHFGVREHAMVAMRHGAPGDARRPYVRRLQSRPASRHPDRGGYDRRGVDCRLRHETREAADDLPHGPGRVRRGPQHVAAR